MEQSVRKPAKIIWDYMHMNMPLRSADCIIGFGNYNLDIARRAAELYFAGYAPKILFSGGLGRNTDGRWTGSEAGRFAAVAMAAGVPERDIILENRSTNSAENILFTREKLRECGMQVKTLLGVHQPFMERRIYAAFPVYWKEVEFIVTSPQVDMDGYLATAAEQGLSEKTALEVMVGDYQRIEVYAKKGYQIPQEIPQRVRDAFDCMVKLGYTGQLIG